MDEDAIRAALAEYEQNGSDLSRPMQIDFFVALPSEAVAHVVEMRSAPMGFTSHVEEDPESGEWLCVCSVEIVPSLERVAALEKLLDRLGRELGGHGGGFGSFGNAERDQG